MVTVEEDYRSFLLSELSIVRQSLADKMTEIRKIKAQNQKLEEMVRHLASVSESWATPSDAFSSPSAELTCHWWLSP